MSENSFVKGLFLSRMRAGLKGMPRSVIEETINDYAAHFDAGVANGRSEEDIAQGLGDPSRLAREIRAEDGVRRWHDERTFYAAMRAVFGMIGLLAVDVFLVLPLLFIVGVFLFVVIVVGVTFSVVGAILTPLGVMGVGAFVNVDWLQGVLIGLGMLCAGVALCALGLLISIVAMNMLVSYGRAHYRTIAAPSEI
ncbi:DUF1700 domain-containing protein [Acetobacter sacchari]|uniref:DUF1700 domain-containing protein n=1 Tax=Acetobacter sacchari TaxID=2661687 RepID=A0ABS3LZ51_9PROT|nr:DUF1700 domain-containing protein [Acetobacter sacchari]MBO1361173.1 DUF1700 domain-containing protein [Acetobacter sacchari]